MIEFLKAFLFGIVEGITEWLPISSTGHMILLNEFVKLDVSDAFYSMFEVVIQLGAILAVVVLFWKDIFPFGKPTGRRRRHSTKGIMRYVKTDIMLLWCKILVSCVPAAIVGILFNDFFEALFYNYITVAIMLILFGVLFIIVETVHKGETVEDQFFVGAVISDRIRDWAFPLIAAIFRHLPPGATTSALMIGVSRTVAAEFTFFSRFRLCWQPSARKFGRIYVDRACNSADRYGHFCLLISSVLSIYQEARFQEFGYYRIILGGLCFFFRDLNQIADLRS
ncbi:MAG: undecaprenyl-diphosphate phosphatase [Lachnospiraceae bacterium]